MRLLILHLKISSGIFCHFSWQILRENRICLKVVKTLIFNFTQHVEDWKAPLMQKCNSIKYYLLIRRMHWWYKYSMHVWMYLIYFFRHWPTRCVFKKTVIFLPKCCAGFFFWLLTVGIVKMDECNGRQYIFVDSVLVKKHTCFQF